MTLVRPRLILFDVGSTLVDPHPSARELVLGALATRGFQVSLEELARVEPAAWRAVSHLMPFVRYGQEESRSFWSAFYSNLLALLELPDEQPTRELLYEVFQVRDNWRLHADVGPALEHLLGTGYRIGVVSNWEEWLEELLETLDVRRYFEVVVGSGVFGRAKPHVSIFQHALSLAGVPPTEAVYVGDNPRDDVAGARAAGLRPILIDRHERTPRIEGVVRIESLDELHRQI